MEVLVVVIICVLCEIAWEIHELRRVIEKTTQSQVTSDVSLVTAFSRHSPLVTSHCFPVS